MHIFSWIRGLVQILRGCLDEGLICLFNFFEAYPDSPPPDSLGGLSYEFARRIFTNLLVRVGGSKLQLCTKKAEFSEACSNQGDSPPTKLRVIGKNGKRGSASDGLLFRQPDVAKYRVKALQKLSRLVLLCINLTFPSLEVRFNSIIGNMQLGCLLPTVCVKCFFKRIKDSWEQSLAYLFEEIIKLKSFAPHKPLNIYSSRKFRLKCFFHRMGTYDSQR